MYIDENLLKKSERVSLLLRMLYAKYGYKQYRMQKFEELDLYLENKDFLESTQIITFNDVDGKLLALKPDVTLSIVKNIQDVGDVEKFFYLESVYRVSKQANKFKEIKQLGLEAIGNIDRPRVLEVTSLALETLKSVDENFILDISHVNFIEGLLLYLDLGHKLSKALKESIVAKNANDVKNILKNKDIIDDAKIKLVIDIINLDQDNETIIMKAKKLSKNQLMISAIEELELLLKDISLSKGNQNVKIDFSLINKSKYYNGVVYQGYVSKVPEVFLSGGSYGKIFKAFGQDYGAIGFAIDLDLLDTYYEK